jgi:hypothetical protein
MKKPPVSHALRGGFLLEKDEGSPGGYPLHGENALKFMEISGLLQGNHKL